MNPLWTPSTQQKQDANVTAFRALINQKYQLNLENFDALYDWSIKDPSSFWQGVWEFCGITASKHANQVIIPHEIFEKTKFFAGAKLNYAENLLRDWDNTAHPAIIFWGEDGSRRELSFAEVKRQVLSLANTFKNCGLQPGDRVAGFMPNVPETMIAMMATAACGAIWASCSQDFGVKGVLDRFGQIEPKIFITCDGYFYNGKDFPAYDKVREILAGLPSVTTVVSCDYTKRQPIEITSNLTHYSWHNATSGESLGGFEQVDFNHPLFIMFSSGTTGIPKCIVHGHGGTLIQHLKEHQLHCDIRPGDRVFYFATCSWMMWNWHASALASGATLLLFDGNPFYPSPAILFNMAEKEGMTLFGTSAKYIDALHKSGLRPRDTHDLSNLRMITSTGSPLAPESFDFIYDGVAPHVCLSSISGGTDIISCFALGNPTGSVWRGELQARGLGMAVDTFDDHGKPIRGQKGELVCTAPFPSMPVGFWGDHEGKKYHSTYFERFPNVWHHGDYVEITEHNGLVIYGRSDAVLNPGGVRIGTAEIYRQVEQIHEVLESLAVGQEWDHDVRVILFVKLRPGVTLTDGLVHTIKNQIRINTTPRHVPAKIIQVPDIPRTISGKIVELAVTNVIHKRPVQNTDALANPEALRYFENLRELSA